MVKINKLIFSIFTVLLLNLSSVQRLYALDNNLNNNSEQESLDISDFEKLPNEVILQILSNIINVYDTDEKKIEQGIKALRSLSLTKKIFYNIISDRKFINYILNTLKHNINISPNFYIQAALLLDTPAAKKWLSKNLIRRKLTKIENLLEQKK